MVTTDALGAFTCSFPAQIDRDYPWAAVATSPNPSALLAKFKTDVAYDVCLMYSTPPVEADNATTLLSSMFVLLMVFGFRFY